jgi:CarD family transcriptional regulator
MTEFKIGDKLFHPVYGTGTLVDLKEEKASGKVTEYLVISLTGYNGRFMTPLERADEVGLRKVTPQKKRPELSKLFGGRPQELPEDHLKRRQRIGEALADGRFKELGHLVRDLAHREAQTGLNAYDRRVFKRAKTLLAQEFALCEEMDTDSVLERIESELGQRFSEGGAQAK